jgi:hypothetical protein
MIAVHISEAQREFANGREIDEQWITEQINRRRRDDLTVCVRVSIQDAPVNLRLSSAGCSGGRASARFSAEQQSIIELWRRNRLDQADFDSGNVIAFLKQLHRVLT